VPGTSRILKGALSLPFILKLSKSQTQPDGGEGYSGMQLGIGDDAWGGSRPAEAGHRERMSLRLRLRHHKRDDE